MTQIELARIIKPRTYWFTEKFNSSYYEVDDEDRRQVTYREANLVSSLLENGLHAPAIDIDLPARLVEGILEVEVEADLNVFPVDEINDSCRRLVELGFARSVRVDDQISDVLPFCLSFELASVAQLLPSSTDDHYHLYVDVELSWDDYHEVLRNLSLLGVVESGYLNMATLREMTMLRKPQASGQLAFQLNLSGQPNALPE